MSAQQLFVVVDAVVLTMAVAAEEAAAADPVA